MADNGTIKCHDIKSLLCSEERDFLIRNNGDQVKVRDLEGKIIGLYFSSSMDYCSDKFTQKFTPKLIEAYDELSQKYPDFEVVFVTDDHFEDFFCKDFSEMPWLSIPFAESTCRCKDFSGIGIPWHLKASADSTATRRRLYELFTVPDLPHLVVLDKNGEITTSEGVVAVCKFGAEAYPFTQERIDLLNTGLEDAKRNQTLRSVLVSSSRDFLISNNGNKVPMSELEGKIVGLFFSDGSWDCDIPTLNLVKVYKILKDRAEKLEVVIVPLDDDESSFQLRFATVPWLAIPFKDKSCQRLVGYFELQKIPTLVVIGCDGKTLVPNGVELLEKYGDQAYPFSLEKMEELAEKEKKRMESPNLESLLVSWEGDYVIGNGDEKIPVSDLMGKNILLYFDDREDPYYLYGFPELTETYDKIKAKDIDFELIFVPKVLEQAKFDNHLSSMPWLSIPFGHNLRAQSVGQMVGDFGYHWLSGGGCRPIPSLWAIGPTGWTFTNVDIEIIRWHGAEAYPFTEEHLKEVASQWPERLQHPLHKEHVLVRTQEETPRYDCQLCGEMGYGSSFFCEVCRFNPDGPCFFFELHPKCALPQGGS